MHDDRKLFEMLTLEGAQAGLSWSTILKRREQYRAAFDNFDIQKVASYSEQKIQHLLGDIGIIRNRLKIQSTIHNAKSIISIQAEYGSFDSYVWAFVSGVPVANHWQSVKDVPARTQLSDTMSKQLKKRCFGFVGSTICYAFIQAIGIVDDHTSECFLYKG